MNNKHRKTLEAIFEDPIRADIVWKDIEKLLSVLGAEIKESAGSRVRFKLNGRRATFHRPHPQKEAGKATVKDVRDFIMHAEVNVYEL